MIYDDHQRNVTAEAAGKFRTAINELSQISKDEISDLEQHDIYIGALQRQAEKLEAEKAEYELVKSGNVEIKVSSVFDLGKNLVNARIKSGMDQADLAKRLNVSDLQIVRSEANEYSVTPIVEIRKIARILNVEIPEEVIPSHFNGKINVILSKLKKAGFNRKFVLSRLILPHSSDKVTNLSGSTLDKYTLGLYKHLNHVFGWTWDELTNSVDLSTSIASSASAKFKVESNRDPEKINVFSMYARYLANFIVDSAKTLPQIVIPTNAVELRNLIIDSYGSVNFENTLNFAWDSGVIVFPLRDKGNFHGICIRIKGRNVIFLNPRKLYLSTWLFDLLHELSHAGQEPDKETFDEIGEVVTSHKRRTSKEELDANHFANTVIFGNNANKLFDRCVEKADGNLNSLKQAILEVAQESHVMVDALANFVAHKLKSDCHFKYQDVLAIAESLQLENGNPNEITQKIFIKRFPFEIKDGIDMDLLLQAFEEV